MARKSLKSEIADALRLRQILDELLKQGFGCIFDKAKIWHLIPVHKRLMYHGKKASRLPQERLRRSMENLGGAFIKLGQLLSVRPDLVPERYCSEFANLQDNVKPESIDSIKKVVEQEHGERVSDMFSKFDNTPVGSASISQVHKARLINGKPVVVKVQRPGIDKVFEADIRILKKLAGIASKYTKETNVNPRTIISEFERYTHEELNFFQELSHIEKFYNNFKNVPEVAIPRPYVKLSTGKTIVMEYIEGEKLIHAMKNRDKKYLKSIGKLIVDACLKQTLEDGYFHADLHPGNIIVINRKKIGLLDFGIVGQMDEVKRRSAISLTMGFVNKDAELVTESIETLCNTRIENNVKQDFSNEIEGIIYEFHELGAKNFSIPKVLYEVISICSRYKVSIPVDFVLFAKTLITSEGTVKKLDPEFYMLDAIKPFAKKLMNKCFGPGVIAKEYLRNSRKLLKEAQGFPDKVGQTLDKLNEGRLILEYHLDNKELEILTRQMNRSSSLTVLGLLVTALIISAALTIEVGPKSFYGFSAISIFLAVMTVIFGIYLVFMLFERYEVEI